MSFHSVRPMSRVAVCTAAGVAAAALLGHSHSAQALCPIQVAGYVSGLYGTDVVTTPACLSPQIVTGGGPGVTAASIPLGTGTMSASADLGSGVLTAYSAGGFASAAEWDTFTFTGLPAGGATITATLSLSGTLTGSATGQAALLAGPSATFANAATLIQDAFFGNGAPIPTSISVAFMATNGSSETVLGDIFADGFSGNVADLADPPVLTIDLPAGVTATSASGVFTSFQVLTSVPEPGTAALLLAGLGGLIRARSRRKAPDGPIA